MFAAPPGVAVMIVGVAANVGMMVRVGAFVGAGVHVGGCSAICVK
jgi:hypothetical protein